jgi:hypothetical protein
MKSKKVFIALVLFAAISAGYAFAQDVAVEPDHLPLLTRLSEEYGVDMAVLEALMAQGMPASEIRFALQLYFTGGLAWEDALARAAEESGFGKAQLAEALGVEKSSLEFGRGQMKNGSDPDDPIGDQVQQQMRIHAQEGNFATSSLGEEVPGNAYRGENGQGNGKRQGSSR